MAWNVVIAGGGFGGFYAARTLERVLPPQSARGSRSSTTSTSCSTRRCCPGAAAGTLEPRHVVVPLREELERTDLRLGTVVGADAGPQRLCRSAARRATSRTLAYDHLIVALGSVSRTLPDPRPGRARRSASSRCPRRSRCATGVLRTLEIAETLEDRRRARGVADVRLRRRRLRGRSRASPSCRTSPPTSIDLYPRCRTAGHALDPRRGARPDHAGDPADAGRLRHARAARPRHRDPHRARRSRRSRADSVTLSGGEIIPTRTRRVDGGRQAAPGRRRARPAARPRRADRGRPHAARRRPRRTSGRSATPPPCPTRRRRARGRRPPTAQHAIRQGRRVGAQRRRGDRRGPACGRSRYKTQGVFVDMGRARPWRTTLGHPLARAAGLVAGAHLPPAAACRASSAAPACSSTGRSGCSSAATPPSCGMLGHPPALQGQSSGGTGEEAGRGPGRTARRRAAPRPRRSAEETGATEPRSRLPPPLPWRTEMTALERVKDDLATARKAGERERVGTLRLVLSSCRRRPRRATATSWPCCAASASAAWRPRGPSATAAAPSWPRPRRPRPS